MTLRAVIAIIVVLVALPLANAQQGEGEGCVMMIRAAEGSHESSVVIGDHLVVVTPGPALSVYDLVTLARLAEIPLERRPNRLVIAGGAIKDGIEFDNPKVLIRLDRMVSEEPDPYDVQAFVCREYTPHDRAGLNWLGSNYVWKRRLFGFAGRGEIRVLDRGKTRNRAFDTSILGTRYGVWVRGAKPLGFSGTTVAALDDDLCPVRVLLEIGKDGSSIASISSDESTIAVGRNRFGLGVAGFIDIWAPGASEPLTTVRLDSTVPSSGTCRAFVPFAGGYLYAGDEFAWVHPDGRTWRYRPARLPGISFSGCEQRIILANHRILMTSKDGDVYVFDPSIVVGHRVPPPTYEGGPRPMLPGISVATRPAVK